MLDKEPLATASVELKTSARLRKRDLSTPGSCYEHTEVHA